MIRKSPRKLQDKITYTINWLITFLEEIVMFAVVSIAEEFRSPLACIGELRT